MKAWLRIPWALLALVAMFATMLPQTLWACPMTGRLDIAARVCLGVMPSMDGEMPCAHTGGKCCKPVTVPPSQNDDDPHHPQALTAGSSAGVHLVFTAPLVQSQPLCLPSPQPRIPVAVRVYLARLANSPPALRSQHRPTATAGRAPPVL